MKYFKSLSVFFSLFITVATFAQERILWRSWEDVQRLSVNEPRKLIVDVYTDWCKICKKMDAYTFKNPEVVAYINEHYYAIRFDAEYKEDIVFKGTKYEFVGNSKQGYHQLAAHILNGSMKYPTTVFLNEDLGILQPLPGYLDTETMMMILSYFGENHHKTTRWKRYEKMYRTRSNYAQPVNNKN